MTPGVGRDTGSTRTELANVTGLHPLGGAMHLWFFPGAPSTSSPVGVSALAKVGSGWYGTLVIGSDTANATVYARDITSTIEILTRACRAAQRSLGFGFRWYIDATGTATIEADEPFVLIANGSVGSRLGFGALNTGGSSYTGFAPAHQTTAPSQGIRLDGAETIARGGGVEMADSGGGYALPGLSRTSESGTLTVYGTHEELASWTLEGTYDVGLLGRWATRIRVRGQRRVSWGAKPDSARVEHEVVGVTL